MIPTQPGLDIVQWTSNTNIPRKRCGGTQWIGAWLNEGNPSCIYGLKCEDHRFKSVIRHFFIVLATHMVETSWATDQLLQLDICWQQWRSYVMASYIVTMLKLDIFIINKFVKKINWSNWQCKLGSDVFPALPHGWEQLLRRRLKTTGRVVVRCCEAGLQAFYCLTRRGNYRELPLEKDDVRCHMWLCLRFVRGS